MVSVTYFICVLIDFLFHIITERNCNRIGKKRKVKSPSTIINVVLNYLQDIENEVSFSTTVTQTHIKPTSKSHFLISLFQIPLTLSNSLNEKCCLRRNGNNNNFPPLS